MASNPDRAREVAQATAYVRSRFFPPLPDQHRPGCAEAGYLHAPAGLVCRCPKAGS